MSLSFFLLKFRTKPDREEPPAPEFVSAGVSLFVGGGACGGGVLYRQRTVPRATSTPRLVPPADHDRLWMWKCFNYTTTVRWFRGDWRIGSGQTLIVGYSVVG
ncbi:hypothetical protein EVAR_32669_1 [Eumeta japonica]|uniref:Uncharacterized protein n=1 Tax=Eumeta variegata TaxID=151549 RepID=A0A4C1VNF5_EUMVA|nr:hypothetical protein EVAR_32669_1 [Eumeta japonica]